MLVFEVNLVQWPGRTVDVQLAVADNLLDHSLLLEVLEGSSGDGAVDLHSVDEDSNGDEAV
jgi:hypothetical protein